MIREKGQFLLICKAWKGFNSKKFEFIKDPDMICFDTMI